MGKEENLTSSIGKEALMGAAKTLAGSLISALLVLTAFYYTTKHQLEVHDKQLDAISEDLKVIKNSLKTVEVEPAKLHIRLESIQNDIIQQREAQKEVYERQNKIYDILFKMNSK